MKEPQAWIIKNTNSIKVANMSTKNVVALDTETHKLKPNDVPAKLVVGTLFDQKATPKKQYLVADDFVPVVKAYLMDADTVLVWHNATYDLNVLIHHDPEFFDLFLKAFAEKRVVCTKIRQLMLNAADPTVRGMQNWTVPEVGGDITSLAGCLHFYYNQAPTGVYAGEAYSFDWRKIKFDKHDPASWRLRFSELDGVKVEDYTFEQCNAITYAIDDAFETHMVYTAQEQRATMLAKKYSIPNPLANSTHESMVDFLLNHMSGIVGLRIDHAQLDVIKADLTTVIDEKAQYLFDVSPYKTVRKTSAADIAKGKLISKDTKAIKELWARAYVLIGVTTRLEPAKYFTEKSLQNETYWEARPGKIVTLTKREKRFGKLYDAGVYKEGKEEDKAHNVISNKDVLYPQVVADLCTDALHTKRLLSAMALKSESPKTPPLIRAELDAIIGTLTSLVDYAAAGKERDTFVEALLKSQGTADKRLRYGMSAYQATGRTSSQKPNLQNLPRESKLKGSFGVRGAILPPEGGCFIQCDYSNAELRALAQQVEWEQGEGSSKLAAEYRKDPNFDPHSFAACALYSSAVGTMYTYDWYKEQAKLSEEARVEQGTSVAFKAIKSNRQICKALNFGLAGGLSPARFVDYAYNYGVNIDIQKSKALCGEWFNIWSEMTKYFADRKKIYSQYALPQAGTEPKIQTIKVSQRSRYCDRFTNSCNNPFQSIVADGAKMAFRAVYMDCYANKKSPFYGVCRPIMFIHDEIVLECTTQDSDVITACANRLKHIMEQCMLKFGHPDIPCVAEPCVTDLWVKGANTEYDDKGRFKVSHPQPK